MTDSDPATEFTQSEPEPATTAATPALPDYMTDPNAILKDTDVTWRYGKPPDYSKTRTFYENTKSKNHPAGSLPDLVENLVKNWEIEASFKPKLSEWRTVNHDRYSFSMNGGPPKKAEHMLQVGTYNAIITPNEYYSPEHSDFASSHKTFKRMMPTFAWEVVEVFSGPPTVAFRWRHWGEMKNDYVGFNNKGEKITAKAHGGPIDITGVTVATVDEDMKITHLDTYQDPTEMFRQIAPEGIVNKQVMNGTDPSAAMDEPEQPSQSSPISTGEAHVSHAKEKNSSGGFFSRVVSSALSSVRSRRKSNDADPVAIETDLGKLSLNGSTQGNKQGRQTGSDRMSPVQGLRETTSVVAQSDSHLNHDREYNIRMPGAFPGGVEEQVHPHAGQAVAAAPHSTETQVAHDEMGTITTAECPFLMNRE
ncbi:hypothetical protein EJ08DRAFT_581714 [Tothia fuscella]|uniref:Pathogen-related protein n=1 Tax=Tothia fuscella TaxID=1048955 RepID=A0A9P4P017_9PEZI|nr:hypothetical protein EJ08DRAFT_581714 [Tothia fuscella]